MSNLPSDPVLSFAEALAFESEYFGSNEELEWEAMNRAGDALGDSLLRDMRELRTIPHRPRILVLVGKGHNGGDALIAAKLTCLRPNSELSEQCVNSDSGQD